MSSVLLKISIESMYGRLHLKKLCKKKPFGSFAYTLLGTFFFLTNLFSESQSRIFYMAQSDCHFRSQVVATGFQTRFCCKERLLIYQGNQRSDPCEPAHEEGQHGSAWADCWIQRNVSRDSVFKSDGPQLRWRKVTVNVVSHSIAAWSMTNSTGMVLPG